MKKLIIITVLLLLAQAVAAEVTLSELIQGIRDGRVNLDYTRFSDTLLKRLFNDEQEVIATEFRAIEAETTLVLTMNTYEYSLPSDLYLAWTATLNPDPNKPLGSDNRPFALKYVPAEDKGTAFSFSTGRPGQFSIWNNKIIFDMAPTVNNRDTVTLGYFSHATDMIAGDSTMSLPDQFKALLIDRVILRCFDRVLLDVSDNDRVRIEAAISKHEERLLGRPPDER